MTLDEKITECVRLWMHSRNLTRTEAAHLIGRPKYSMFALLQGHCSWQVKDIQALIRCGCSLPEELKQAPDHETESDSIHLTTEGPELVVRMKRDGALLAERRLDHEGGQLFLKYLTYMVSRINPLRYSRITVNTMRAKSRGQLGTKRPSNRVAKG